MRGRKKKKTIKKSHRAEAATDSAADEDVDNMHVYHEEDGAEWQFLDVVCIFLKLIFGFSIEIIPEKFVKNLFKN
jgi:hypothetical protein